MDDYLVRQVLKNGDWVDIRSHISDCLKPGEEVYTMHYCFGDNNESPLPGAIVSRQFSPNYFEHISMRDYLDLLKVIDGYEAFDDLREKFHEEMELRIR